MMEACSICATTGSKKNQVSGCGDGWLCQGCADSNRIGKDLTTQRSKLAQKALAGKSAMKRGVTSDLDVFAIESAAMLALDDGNDNPLIGAGGEVVPQGDAGLRDTMQNPTAVAMDASAERLRLVAQVGVDVTALALDTADSIQASNSLERMLSAQLAVLHSTALNYVSKANLNHSQEHAVRTMNLGIRAMEVFQKGMLTVKRMRSNGNQQIVIKHIDNRDGGMLAVSGIQPTGKE